MGLSKNTYTEKLVRAAWHYTNCPIEYENDPDSGTTAWCEPHQADVTECLPDFSPEPDMYDSSEENLNAI